MPNSPSGEGELLRNQRQITLDPTTTKQQMAGLEGFFLDWANPNRHWTKEVVNLSAHFNLTQTQEQILLHPYPRRLGQQTALPASWSHAVTQANLPSKIRLGNRCESITQNMTYPYLKKRSKKELKTSNICKPPTWKSGHVTTLREEPPKDKDLPYNHKRQRSPGPGSRTLIHHTLPFTQSQTWWS